MIWYDADTQNIIYLDGFKILIPYVGRKPVCMNWSDSSGRGLLTGPTHAD